LYDCVGDEDDELSFNEGDLITSGGCFNLRCLMAGRLMMVFVFAVVDEEDEWLRGVHVKTGSSGLFPEAYITGWEAEA
jgi:hypothetical protein